MLTIQKESDIFDFEPWQGRLQMLQRFAFRIPEFCHHDGIERMNLQNATLDFPDARLFEQSIPDSDSPLILNELRRLLSSIPSFGKQAVQDGGNGFRP